MIVRHINKVQFDLLPGEVEQALYEYICKKEPQIAKGCIVIEVFKDGVVDVDQVEPRTCVVMEPKEAG